MRRNATMGLSPAELADQEVFELPNRVVLTLVDPNLATGALSYLGGLPPAPAGTPPATGSVPDQSAATTAQNATHLNTYAPQSTLSATNVNSPGATSGGMTSQYAPIVQGT